MPATQRGIYHNLKESKYTISNSEIVFFFSSRFYMTKFMDGYKQNRESFMSKVSQVAKETNLNMETLADIEYYLSVEKRGYRVRLKNVYISKDDLHNYALRKMMESESLDWQIINPSSLRLIHGK